MGALQTSVSTNSNHIVNSTWLCLIQHVLLGPSCRGSLVEQQSDLPALVLPLEVACQCQAIVCLIYILFLKSQQRKCYTTLTRLAERDALFLSTS